MKKAIPYFVLGLLAFILILMSNTCFFSSVGVFWDAAVYLNVSKNLVEGAVLYKDIVDNKGPVLYFINYLGLKFGRRGISMFYRIHIHIHIFNFYV